MIILVALQYITNYCVTSSQVYSRNEVGLTAIPNDIPSNTTHLHLINNAITEISETDLAHLGELLELALGGNPLQVIHTQALVNNQKLTHLYLSNTQLLIPPDLTSVKNSLIELKLDNTKIKNISDYYFTNMSSLDKIFLDYTKLSAITIGNLGKLRYIFIRHSMLTFMPELLHVLPKLTHLYLHNNQIVNISHSYFNNTPALVVLHIENNLLTSFPNLEPVLSSIRYIYVRNNQMALGHIDQIARMPQLYDILLAQNKFTNLTFGKSDTLWRIYIHNNKLNYQHLQTLFLL